MASPSHHRRWIEQVVATDGFDLSIRDLSARANSATTGPVHANGPALRLAGLRPQRNAASTASAPVPRSHGVGPMRSTSIYTGNCTTNANANKCADLPRLAEVFFGIDCVPTRFENKAGADRIETLRFRDGLMMKGHRTFPFSTTKSNQI